MAISSYKTFLMSSSDGESAWQKVIDIKDYGDLGGPPEQLETTTLSDKMQTFINGIQKLDALTFTANYTKEDYTKLNGMAGKSGHYAVWFGGADGVGTAAPTPSGDQGKFKFDGELSVYVTGKGVNEVVEMVITIAPSSPIVLDEP